MDQHKRCEIFLNSPMYQRILFKILLTAITATLASSKPSCRKGINELTQQCACEVHESFSISCANNQTIHISNAFYGRYDNITCNDEKGAWENWSLTCASQNSTKVASERCDNRTNCSFGEKEYNNFFGDPCAGTGKYLIVNYTCVSGESYTPSVNTEPTSLTPTRQSTKASTERPKTSRGAPYASSVDTEPASLTPTSQSTKALPEESKRSTGASYTSSVVTEPASRTPTSQSTKSLPETSKISTADLSSVHSTGQPAMTTTKSGCSCSSEQRRNVEWQNAVCDSNGTAICPNNKNSKNAHRWCSKNGTWSQPNLSGCVNENIEQLSKGLESLRTNFTVVAVKELLEQVKHFSKSNDLYGGDLYELANIMVQFIALSQNNGKSFTVHDAEDFSNLVLNSTSNLLSSTCNDAWNELPPSEQSKTATRILVGMEDSLAVLAAATNTAKTTKKEAPGIAGVQIDVIDVKSISEADPKTPITFSVGAGMSQTNGNKNGEQLETHSTHDVRLEISLEDVKTRASGDGLGRAVFILYDDIEQRLKTTSDNDSPENNKEAETGSYFEPFIITNVVSASIISDEEHSTKLKNPIRFTLRHKSHQLNSSSMSCVFWKFSKDDFVGHWSDEGCKVASSTDDTTTCECDHLTNFAVLMSATNKTISTEHLFALHLITNIGCAISIVCLALALFIFCFFRNLQCDRNTIHKNLVFSLLIAELIFVFGIVQYDKQTLCAVVAGFLHYFFLAAFAWMCLEGVQLYIFLIEVFEIEKSRVKWYYLGGYGVPALIVLISALVNIKMMSDGHGGYGTKDYCWLDKKTNFVWAFNGPVIAVFAVNLVMLGLAIYMMWKHASAASWKLKEKSKIYKIGSWLRGAAILVVLLGTTWIFGIFLIFDKETLIFEYIFTILNSLQGLFIFVFHCLINEKVQKEFQRAIQRSSWLPDCVRVKYTDWAGSMSPSTPTHSNSSGKSRFQWILSKSKRRESTLSDSSLLQKVDSTSSDNKVRVILSPTQEETYPTHINLASECTGLTDSSGYSDHLDSSEDLRGYRESVISCVNESKFDEQDQIE